MMLIAAPFALLDGKWEEKKEASYLAKAVRPPPHTPTLARSLGRVLAADQLVHPSQFPHSSGGMIRPGGGGVSFSRSDVLPPRGSQGAISSPNIPSDRNPAKYRLRRVKNAELAYPVGLSGLGRAGRHKLSFLFFSAL